MHPYTAAKDGEYRYKYGDMEEGPWNDYPSLGVEKKFVGRISYR